MTMVSPWVATSLFVSGWVIFPASFLFQKAFWFQTGMGHQIMKCYSLTKKDCIDISNKIVSSFQALLASISGFIICFNCHTDVIKDSHPMTLIYAWFGIPYFIYDAISMFYIYKSSGILEGLNFGQQVWKFVKNSPMILFHHLFLAPIGFCLVVFWRGGPLRHGDYFVGVIYMMETSTPFVSLRFILSKLKMKSSMMYITNGIMMLVSFPVFRIATLFHAAWLYSVQYKVGYFQTLWELPFGWKIVFILALVPQVYWYGLMCMGLLRMILNKKKEANFKFEGKSFSNSSREVLKTIKNSVGTAPLLKTE